MRIVSWVKGCVQTLGQWFDKPVPALPVDLFRVAAGALSAAYFWHLYREVSTISSTDGFIDHELVEKMFPYTRLGLLPLDVSDRVLRAVTLAAVGSSLSVAAGVGIRPNAAFLYATAVSTYRRNFIAMYVDDAIMHLVLFWLLLLPTGKTLTLNKQMRQPWQTATVPGFGVRAFLANLSLIYLVAGMWKWNSQLWKQGLALYAALKMPISYAPRFWSARWQPLLRPMSYSAIFLEPLAALLPLLPTDSRLKYGVGAGLFALHGGIIGLLRVPYANIACLAALPLLFRDELMLWLAPSTEPDPVLAAQTPRTEKIVASTLLTLLTLANIWRISEWGPAASSSRLASDRMRHHRNPWHGVLWLIGIAQSYRLMDWIDALNWHTYYEGEERISAETRPFDPERLFPTTSRNVFLHSYIQNRPWMVPPAEHLAELQTSLLTRYVEDFARQTPNTGKITIYANTGQITRDNIGLHQMQRFKLLQFSVQDGRPTIHFMRLVSED